VNDVEVDGEEKIAIGNENEKGSRSRGGREGRREGEREGGREKGREEEMVVVVEGRQYGGEADLPSNVDEAVRHNHRPMSENIMFYIL